MQQDTYKIAPVSPLSDFIDRYPIQQMRKQFQLLEGDFPHHRKVKGDGNCFYRAFAFLYLVKHQINLYSLPAVKNICRNQMRTMFQQSDFQQKFSKYLDMIISLEGDQRKQFLIEKHFNQSSEFDAIIISYFRSANYAHILKNKEIYIPYIDQKNSISTQLERVSHFNSESEGIELPALAQLFKVKLVIFFVNEDTFQPVVLNEATGKQVFYLFFRPGHYDIVFPQNYKVRFSFKNIPNPKPIPMQALRTLFNKQSNQKDNRSISKSRITPQNIKSTISNSSIKVPPAKQIKSSHQSILKSSQQNQNFSFKYNKMQTPAIHDTKDSSQRWPQVKKKNKSKIVTNSYISSSFHSLFIELLAIGLFMMSGYFLYSLL